MKKNKILKLFLIFICLIAISFVGNNVYGYQLKFKALPNVYQDGSARIVTFGVTAASSNVSCENGNYTDDNYKLSEYSYNTYKIVFHDKLNSEYSTTEGIYYVGYDKTKEGKIIDQEILNFSDWKSSDSDTVKKYLETLGVYVKEGSSKNKSIEFERKTKDFYLKSQKIISTDLTSISDGKPQTATISTWYLSNKAINDIISNFEINSENNQVYFSLAARVLHSGKIQNWDTTYNTLFQIASAVGWWDPLNFEKNSFDMTKHDQYNEVLVNATRLFSVKFI